MLEIPYRFGQTHPPQGSHFSAVRNAGPPRGSRTGSTGGQSHIKCHKSSDTDVGRAVLVIQLELDKEPENPPTKTKQAKIKQNHSAEVNVKLCQLCGWLGHTAFCSFSKKTTAS